MKTAFVGGGKGCRSLLEFILEGGLTQLMIEVCIVLDVREDSPGIEFARERGIPTGTDLREAFAIEGLELVVELTGSEEVAGAIYHMCPPGVRVMDHALARLFWDLIHAERRLVQEREQVQNILDRIPDIVMVLDREMRIRTVNASFTDYSKLESDEAEGMLCHETFCAGHEGPIVVDDLCPFQEVMRTGERVNVVQVRKCTPGEEEHFEITMSPLRDENGEITGVVEALHPITERVRLTREVQEAAQRFRQFIDSAQDLISIKDLGGRYTDINEATAKFFDKRVEDCIGKAAGELYPLEIARIIEHHDREVIRRKEAITYEETLPLKGRDYYMNTVRFPLLDYKGDAVGVCTISRDVTQSKRLQRELVQTDKLAALGKLAMSVAHEINSPLTGILAYAEDLLEDADPTDERSEDYRVIMRETLRCREIVRNLLDFAKERAPVVQEADLNRVVRRTIQLVERLPVFKDIEIVQDLSETLPTVSGDPHQLQQIVLNLLVNAAEQMPTGGRIDISTGSVVDGTACYIRVADTGPGIPEELLGRIFEPFVSSKTATHGLGLAVSWGIVQRHGGTIEAGNQEEGGAEFRVVLPLGEGRRNG